MVVAKEAMLSPVDMEEVEKFINNGATMTTRHPR